MQTEIDHEYCEIDFDGDNFCMTMLEIIATSIVDDIRSFCPLFCFNGPTYNSSKNYFTSISMPLTKNMVHEVIGNLIIGENIVFQTLLTPSNVDKRRWGVIRDKPNVLVHSGMTWQYALADPKSIDRVANAMQEFYTLWEEWCNRDGRP